MSFPQLIAIILSELVLRNRSVQSLCFAGEETVVRVCPSDENLVIPRDQTRIDNETYIGCASLLSVVIGDSVTSIGDQAFAYCESLQSATFGESLEYIGRKAFFYCKSLKSVTIPKLVGVIEPEAFCFCESLARINVHSDNPYYIDRMGILMEMETFKVVCCPGGWDESVNYTVPKYVTSIGDYAFRNSQWLDTIDMGVSSVKRIGKQAFAHSRYLEVITLPKSLVSIDDEAFASCKKLTEITIPELVTDIGIGAFMSCTSLAKLTFKNSTNQLENISNFSFCECTSLKSVSLPKSVRRIGDGAFKNCISLSQVVFGDLEYIGSCAFAGCSLSSNSSIEIPKSVSNLGAGAFNCDDIKEIKVHPENENYYLKEEDDIIFSTDNTTLVQYFNKVKSSYEIPHTVTTIKNYAFYKGKLKSVTIPDSITHIGNYTFYGSNLTSVTMADSVKEIGKYAFAGCTNLSHVTLSKSLTRICEGAFTKCGMTSIELPESLESIESEAFGQCYQLKEIVIPESVNNIDVHGFWFCSSLTSVTFSSTSPIDTIKGGTFQFCRSLTSVLLPDSLRILGSWAFGTCSSLAAIKLPSSLEEIGNGAFGSCISLTDVEIPGSVTNIGTGVFMSCTSLETIKLDSSNKKYIARDGVLFYSNLSELIQFPPGRSGSYRVPDSVEIVHMHAFYGCSLSAVDIPGPYLFMIRTEAFRDCKALETVRISICSIGTMSFCGCEKLSRVEYMSQYLPHGDYSVFQDCDTNNLEAIVPYSYEGNEFLGLRIQRRSMTFSEIPSTVWLVGILILILIGKEIAVRYVKTPSQTNNEDTKEVPISGCKKVFQTIKLYAWAGLIILSLFMTSYISFTAFFYCCSLIVFTPLTTGLSYLGQEDRSIAWLILWLVYAIPFIAILLSINYQLLTRFFTNYSGIFNIERVVEYIRYQLNKPPGRKRKFTLFGLRCLSILAVIIAFLLLFEADGGFVVGLISVTGPIWAFIKVTFAAWKELVECVKFYVHRRKASLDDERSTKSISLTLGLEESTNTIACDTEFVEKEHHMSLSDPFNVRNQEEWLEFLESDANIFVHLRKMGSNANINWVQVILCAMFAVVTLVYTVFDIVRCVNNISTARQPVFQDGIKQTGDLLTELQILIEGDDVSESIQLMYTFASSMNEDLWSVVIRSISRIILEIYMIPFIVSANIGSVFIKWKSLAKQNIVRLSQCIALGIGILYCILFILWRVLVINTLWWNDKDNNMSKLSDYIPHIPSGNSTTIYPRAGICDVKIGSWSVLELAMMSVLGNIKIHNKKILKNISTELISNSDDFVGYEFSITELFGIDNNGTISSWIKDTMNDDGTLKSRSPVYVFPGAIRNTDFALIVENVVKYWFDVVINSLIPMFSQVRKRIMNRDLESMAWFMDDILVGFESPTKSILQQRLVSMNNALTAMNYMMKIHKLPTSGNIIVGHSSGSLVAKAFGIAKDMPVIAFDSPVFEHSKSYNVFSGLSGFRWSDGWERMTNAYSDGSLFCGEEEQARMNMKYPSASSFFKPTNPYETFCMIAAGCVSDDRYDHFCNISVGNNTYKEYFMSWSRYRTTYRSTTIEIIQEKSSDPGEIRYD